jgi:hypothetical protein
MTTLPMIKQSASYDLRVLLYNTLVSDPVLTSRVYLDEKKSEVTAKVYDTVPPKVKKPYVTVGKATVRKDQEVQSKDMFIDLHMVEIDCFTHYGGKSDVAQLQNDAMRALGSAWANGDLQFDEDSAFLIGLFEIDTRGEDVSVWGPKDAEHFVFTCFIRVVQVNDVDN